MAGSRVGDLCPLRGSGRKEVGAAASSLGLATGGTMDPRHHFSGAGREAAPRKVLKRLGPASNKLARLPGEARVLDDAAGGGGKYSHLHFDSELPSSIFLFFSFPFHFSYYG